MGTNDSNEKELDVVLLVQATAVSAKNYSPYDLLFSHPLLDHDIATTRGNRRGFLVLPACEGLSAQTLNKQMIYDGQADLKDIADNASLCRLLQHLRYCIPQDEENENEPQLISRPLKDNDIVVDILRPETLEDALHTPNSVHNGLLVDSWVMMGVKHPYYTLYEDVPEITRFLEESEAKGGCAYKTGDKIKVRNRDVDVKMGVGDNASVFFPKKGIKFIKEWCEKNIYANLKLANVTKENMSIKVTRLDGMPFDHSITNKENGQDDGIRSLGSLNKTNLKDRCSGVFLSVDVLAWPLPPPQPLN